MTDEKPNPAEQQPPGTKRCPHCGGEIKSVAVKCPHCQEPLTKSSVWEKLSVVGLVLGLVSLVTCGYSALPGLVLCVIALCRKKRIVLSAAGTAVCLAALALVFPLTPWHPSFIGRARVNAKTAALGFPPVPSSAHNIRMYSWSFLASRYMLLRFDAPREEVDEFFRQLKASPVKRIGTGKDEVVLVTYEELDRIREEQRRAIMEGKTDDFDMDRYEHVSRNPSIQAWYCPYTIKKGKFYTGPMPKGEYGLGFHVWHDEENGTVFFQWIGS